MKIRTLVILFLGVLSTLTAQDKFSILENSQVQFEHITSEDGLMHNSIISIIQDSKGYMWFGTNNGLYKYNGYEFKFYTSSPDDSGSLLNENVKALYEDNQGNLWIGTLDGLSRYNRKRDAFERYFVNNLNKKSKITDPIHCIYQDNKGVVWVGTRYGLYRLTAQGNDIYDIRLINYNDSENGLSSNTIYSIDQDQFGQLWIGTNKGYNLLQESNDGTISFKHYNSRAVGTSYLKNDNFSNILIGKEGHHWIATKKGLNKITFDKETGRHIVSEITYPYDTSSSMADNRITTLVQDRQGFIWGGTKMGGLIKFDPKKEIFRQYQQSRSNKEGLRSNEISGLYIDVSGVLWIGMQRGGLSKLNLEDKNVAHYRYNYFDPNSLSGNTINNIYEDSKKNLWISTFDQGLNRLVNKNGDIKFIRYKHDKQDKNTISSNRIFGFCEDNYGNYWVGTQSNGLNHIKISDQLGSNKLQVKHYKRKSGVDNFPWNRVTYIYKDKIGDIWVGFFGSNGLMRFTPTPFGGANPVFHVFKHDPDNPNSLSGSTVSCVFEDSQGVLWIGTNRGGLEKILRDDQNNPVKFIKIVNEPNNTSSLSNNNVFTIHEDIYGNIWVGTFGGGLNKIAKNQRDQLNPKIVRYSTKDGLPSNEIYGILEDNSGNLWMSTNNGISKFNHQENTFTNLDLSDGLQDVNFRKFAYAKDHNGLMYFGGIKGFNVLDPNSIEENKYMPSAEIVDFKLFNQSVKPGEEVLGSVILDQSIENTNKITLKNKHNTFAFEFSAMHYASPNQNNYAYMLEGFDEDWIYADSKKRFAPYSNLEAGTYTFKVKASNNDNIWNEDFKSLEIKVLPPLWKSWWAYLIYVGLFVIIMWLFRRYILIDQEYQNKLRFEKIESEKIKEVNKIKLEFFTNVSHEFKTPLTLLLGPIKELINSKETSNKVKDSLVLMERNANQLFKLINQIMEFRKVETKDLKLYPTKGDLVNFCKEEVFSFKVLADKKNINLTFESSEYSIDGFFDWDKMETILNNLISNSLKYSNEGEKVKVSLSLLSTKNVNNISTESTPKFVRIIIEDTGEGIPQNQLALIFERFHRVNKKNKKAGAGGSGIGLALTKSLVELHKGKITVESVEKKGSKFVVDLPLLIDVKSLGQPVQGVDVQLIEDQISPSDAIISEVKAIINEEEGDDEQKPTVLLVEDNPDMLEFIRKALESQYNIRTALDGEQGLEIAFESVPDLIVSDVMMPIMDGIEFCEKAKDNELTSHIPIILLTAKGSTDHRIEGLEVGADAYISKPFDMRLLKVRIEKLLGQREVLKKKFTAGGIKLDSEKYGINDQEKIFLKKLEDVIEENLTNSEFGVEDLSSALGYSRMQLYRKLKSIRGLSANEFIREYRIKKAAVLLRETDMRVFEVLYEVGISNHSYFTKCFKQHFNQSPREYINTYRSH